MSDSSMSPGWSEGSILLCLCINKVFVFSALREHYWVLSVIGIVTTKVNSVQWIWGKLCLGHITRGVGKLGIEFDDDTLRVSEGSLYL